MQNSLADIYRVSVKNIGQCVNYPIPGAGNTVSGVKFSPFMNNSDYRKIYTEYYHFEIPTDWDIHHIDYNHNNNNPNNLVALPKSLHQQLHLAYSEMKQFEPDERVEFVCYSGKANSYNTYLDYLTRYLEVLSTCVKYMNLREGVCL